ncbi:MULTISPECIES: nucleotide pyrophosphohydrolase [Staphylococcaceae]|uniref:Nucleotide pyrophosphohydrolase n=1 Tax=Macrococcus psychrotolerans TaxID=3039389 RepID=A0AAU6RMY0_9STAP|nr:MULTISPECIES: nucleotide pyrophosphohydrolase [Macrococcus]MDJ1112536.1 nucleotide pyrophosphohydrolase [Macrococcus sp. S115]MEB8171508.1 nucleotide pyrophosphohydrolase [Macrococcus caseolyticus]PKE19522.1 nucleotide pyrophosphohydrolase [Macrococcus caseolyticus]PKE39860.1 nucleotide pyrophosphohydrolase [Macrococcus caseolyticus]PKE61584.1 nucleotide pyrophosphohydrolase [Macrococcus caseolyticus]
MEVFHLNQEIIDLINKFREERNWNQYHNPKDLSLSLSLEAAELLENFQWISSDEAVENNRENIAEELADVFIYGIQLAEEMGFDIEKIIREKVKKNGEKYKIS